MNRFSLGFGNSLIFFRFPKNNFLSLLPSFRLKTNQLIKKFSLSDFKYHRKKTQFIKTEANEAVV